MLFRSFVDQVMRPLSPVEAVVWMTLFRDCRNGTATASNRDLARRTGCSLRAVHDAMQKLRRVRLVDGVTLSHRRGEPSVYAVNQRPETCLPAIAEKPDEEKAVHEVHRIV